MTAREIFDTTGGFVALGALIGVFLLVPLYLSQRRDLRRLRAWAEREPGYAAENLARNEQRLDEAETELEQVMGETVISTSEPAATPAGGIPAATRVTHERPALERVTMERAALQPHPRWRRFVSRVTQPRTLVLIGIVALALGAGAIFASEQLLSGDDTQRKEHAARIDPGEIKVAVLNGTSVNGLAGTVTDTLTAAGYDVIATTSAEPGFTKTEVLFADGQKPAAQRVARELGVKEVKRLDPDHGALAPGADVVVIAGEDRA